MVTKSTKRARVKMQEPPMPMPLPRGVVVCQGCGGAGGSCAGCDGSGYRLAPIVPQPLPAPIDIPGKDPWYRSILTDHNGDFDMGAVLVGVVTVFMCANSGFDTVMLHTKFDAQSFGIGIAAVLGGFAAYKWGDAKRPDTTVTSVTASTVTTGPTP